MRSVTDEIKQQKGYYNIAPQKFALWLGIVSMSMLFAAFTSAMLVRSGDVEEWMNFPMPSMFYVSTGIILGGSLCIQLAYKAFKSAEFKKYRLFLTLTTVAGFSFALTQYLGWQQMMGKQIFLDGLPSGSFVYLLTGVHVLHVVVGLIFLVVALINAYLQRKNPEADGGGIVNQSRLLNLDMIRVYWHFVDFLWIYLLVFMLVLYK